MGRKSTLLIVNLGCGGCFISNNKQCVSFIMADCNLINPVDVEKIENPAEVVAKLRVEGFFENLESQCEVNRIIHERLSLDTQKEIFTELLIKVSNKTDDICKSAQILATVLLRFDSVELGKHLLEKSSRSHQSHDEQSSELGYELSERHDKIFNLVKDLIIVHVSLGKLKAFLTSKFPLLCNEVKDCEDHEQIFDLIKIYSSSLNLFYLEEILYHFGLENEVSNDFERHKSFLKEKADNTPLQDVNQCILMPHHSVRHFLARDKIEFMVDWNEDEKSFGNALNLINKVFQGNAKYVSLHSVTKGTYFISLVCFAPSEYHIPLLETLPKCFLDDNPSVISVHVGVKVCFEQKLDKQMFESKIESYKAEIKALRVTIEKISGSKIKEIKQSVQESQEEMLQRIKVLEKEIERRSNEAEVAQIMFKGTVLELEQLKKEKEESKELQKENEQLKKEKGELQQSIKELLEDMQLRKSEESNQQKKEYSYITNTSDYAKSAVVESENIVV